MSNMGLSYVFFSIWLCGSNCVESGFKIHRSKLDIFTNLKCTDGACSNTTCTMYGAECISENNCEHCRCLEGRNTFMISSVDQGVCTRDEYIEPKSVPRNAFWLKNQHKKCLQLKSFSNKFIIGKNCIASPTPNMLWIRTTMGDGQLMNVKSLKCMMRTGIDGGKVNLRQCRIIATWQEIQCTENGYKMEMWWNVWNRTDKTTTKRFLHLPNLKEHDTDYAISLSNGDQKWTGINQTSCATNTIYEGCYRFLDGSFMQYFNYSKTITNLGIFAPIFEQSGGNCSVSDKFKFTRDGQQWKDSEGSLFNITKDTDDTQELKISSMENLRNWNGSLLKLKVSCGSGDKSESHCVLLKLESLSKYSKEYPTDYSTSTKKAVSSTLSTRSSNSRRPTTTENPQRSVTEERTDSEGANTTVIAATVPLLLLALALALVFIVYYRRRKRTPVPVNNNIELGAINYSREIYEDPDSIRETQENGNAVSPSRPGTSSVIYSHPNKTTTVNPPSNELKNKNGELPSDLYSVPNKKVTACPPSKEQEYVYARETDFPKNKGQKYFDMVYETLEQPKKECLYSLPQKTKKSKPLSDTEYTYCNDITDASYDRLEQEQPAGQDEEEYSYAKNTDIPLFSLGTQKNNGHSSPPNGSGLYHTLEEPNPPQPPVYSTLAESTDADNQKLMRFPSVCAKAANINSVIKG